MIIFVVVELVVIVICMFISIYMINNRIGLAKKFVIGKEDEEVIKKVNKIPMEIVSTGKFKIDETLEGYDVKINTQNGLIVTIEVETSKIHLICNLIDNKKIIHNKAWSKKGAIAILTFTLWTYSFLIQFIIIAILIVIK